MPRQDATLWSPPTCGCKIYFRLDGQGNVVYLDSDDVKREHQNRKMARDKTINPRTPPSATLCEEHKNLGQVLDPAHVNVLRAEAFLWQNVRTAIQEAVPSFSTDDYSAEFDSKRELKVILPDKLTGSQKATVRQALDSKFGTGKVKLI